MSRCSQKCNELKEKIDNISGLDDDYIFEILSKIENQIDLINKYADEDTLNGTCFKNCNMSKADYMFEKLGYKNGSGHNLGNGEKYIYYSGNYNNINLYKKSKKININGSFSMQELQAIYQKCKELGLLE